jgi:hypothetical protein
MPFSIDSRTVDAPSYPAIAIEANPANRAKWRFRRRHAAPKR